MCRIRKVTFIEFLSCRRGCWPWESTLYMDLIHASGILKAERGLVGRCGGYRNILALTSLYIYIKGIIELTNFANFGLICVKLRTTAYNRYKLLKSQKLIFWIRWMILLYEIFSKRTSGDRQLFAYPFVCFISTSARCFCIRWWGPGAHGTGPHGCCLGVCEREASSCSTNEG